MRVLRVVVAVLLGASGALMYAASAERWNCGLAAGCAYREDHRYDFIVPTAPWEPVGQAAQLAGWSLLVLAVALPLLPWALTGRRPGVLSAVATLGAAPAMAAAGVATLRSGLTGAVVAPVGGQWAMLLAGVVVPILLVRFSVAARGWPLAASILLVIATPFVAAFSYAVGSYDANPWWEGLSGMFTIAAGACLLAAAARGLRSRTPDDVASGVVPSAVSAGGAPSLR